MAVLAASVAPRRASYQNIQAASPRKDPPGEFFVGRAQRPAGREVSVGGPPRRDGVRSAPWLFAGYSVPADTSCPCGQRRPEAGLLPKHPNRQSVASSAQICHPKTSSAQSVQEPAGRELFVGCPPRGDAGRRTANISRQGACQQNLRSHLNQTTTPALHPDASLPPLPCPSALPWGRWLWALWRG